METTEIRRRKLKLWFEGKSFPEREKSYLSQLTRGKAPFGEKAARRLENEYGMPTGYLDSSLDLNTAHSGQIHKLIPLLSWRQAKDWGEIINTFQTGEAMSWYPCPVKHGDRTFILEVRGESMYNPGSKPSFQDGDMIFVDPDKEFINGSIVVVNIDSEDEASFKKLIVEGGKKYLKSINPAWPEKIIEMDGNSFICGVVIFKGEKI